MKLKRYLKLDTKRKMWHSDFPEGPWEIASAASAHLFLSFSQEEIHVDEILDTQPARKRPLPSITFRVDGMLLACSRLGEARSGACSTEAYFEAIIKAARDRGISISGTDFEVTIRAGLDRLTGPQINIITDD